MEIIVTTIPKNLVSSLLSSFLALSYKPKTRIKFSASWLCGNKK